MARPQDNYQGYNASPTGIAETQTPYDYMNVRANSEDFGGQIGQAMQNAGGQAQKVGGEVNDLAMHYQELAAHAQANDVIANQFVPAATQLSGSYYKLQGKDAVDGFQLYMDSISKLREQTLQNLPPMQAELVGSFITRHLTNEYDGAMRHQDQQMTDYEKNSSNAFINAQGDLAVNAGSNPDVINQAIQTANARIVLQAQNEGIHPGTPEGDAIIEQQQRETTGKIASRVIDSAVLRGDISFANNFYANSKDTIAADHQLNIDKMLHAENMRSFGDSAADAIIGGIPIPHPPNSSPEITNVKATVAQTAQVAGLDPNSSLMIASLESSFGQNVGKRGDIGQTGKPAANISEQAQNMIDMQREAQEAADKAVGGKAQPWQMYTVYQQGVGGGTALLKPENANVKAIDVLAPFYKNPSTALQAIQNNGGNASMTAGQFTNFLKEKCETTYGHVACDTTTPDGQPIDLGKAIVDPHQTDGTTLQQAQNPVKQFQQFDAQYPDMLKRAMDIPNIDQRNATLSALEERHKLAQASATAWKIQFSGKIQDIVTDPNFISMNDSRITPDLRLAMQDDPAMLTMTRNMAKANLEEAQGKDSGKLGPAYWDTFKKINNGEITNISQLNEIGGSGLTREGLKQAQDDLKNSLTPDGAGENKLREQTYKAVRSMIVGKADSFGIPDPHAEETYGHAMALMLKAEQQGKKDKVQDMYDPESPRWIGNVAKPLVKSINERVAEIGQNQGVTNPNGPPPLKDRIVGKLYPAPNGQVRWTGQGWQQVPSVPVSR